jgi:hypothetical protein
VTGFPEPTRKDHQDFCLNEGWRQVRNARGKVGHHVTFELALPDGQVLRTRVSHPPDRETYGPSLWSHILRDQLRVDENEFWACVREKKPPRRGRREPTRPSIPAGVVAQLLSHGVRESEVQLMSREKAIELLNRIWSQEAGGGS